MAIALRKLGALREGTVETAPSWVIVVTWVLSFVGLGIATYLTIVHFDTAVTITCVAHSGFNCVKVTTSGESYFLHIPVAVLGLLQYVAMVGLCSPWAWRSSRREIHLARLAFAVVGMGFVLWLFSAEALIIKAFCLWCSGVHVVTFLIFICVIRTVPAMLGWTEPAEDSRAAA
ncbi:MAG TPA: vitamin K epoxide reductase family protein [Acidimicrobiales bacterium]|jgi:uncharacterized membrane protein|nr:vitamin K epoxide reductase family protein [Acidimicrobiales bacterium]